MHFEVFCRILEFQRTFESSILINTSADFHWSKGHNSIRVNKTVFMRYKLREISDV